MKAILEVRYITSREEVEQLISSTWGYTFSVALATGYKAGTLEYRITGTFPTDAALKRAASIRAGKRDRNLQLILDVLCHVGDIPPGLYSIRESLPPVSSAVRWEAGDLRIVGVAV